MTEDAEKTLSAVQSTIAGLDTPALAAPINLWKRIEVYAISLGMSILTALANHYLGSLGVK